MIIVPLKERRAGTNFFGNKHSTAGRNTQTMDDCKFCYQNKCRALHALHADALLSRDGWLQLEWWNKSTALKKIECLR